jgi:dTDP-4-amino-4,6-dideoxygalactose transaminase
MPKFETCGADPRRAKPCRRRDVKLAVDEGQKQPKGSTSLLAVMKPKLPQADAVLPYLRKIDASRLYSNFGPLNAEFEERVAQRYGASDVVATTASNATIALTLVLNGFTARPGALCAMPAWTFVASAHAAIMAGLKPYFLDVDPTTWALDPEATAAALTDAPGEVAAVMPVSPFGRPLDIASWETFRERTGIPVVIDAAAGFDTVKPSSIPTVVSLHATKVLGIGEGAIVLSTDSALMSDIRARSNFGFRGSREARMPATNAKLSEYHAAVGLAALDEWPQARAQWMAAAVAYQHALPSNHLRLQAGFGETWVSSTSVLELSGPHATRAEKSLAEARVETRRWWGLGAHHHPATAGFPRTALPVTERFAEGTLAVPFHRDLSPAAIAEVARALRDAGIYPES